MKKPRVEISTPGVKNWRGSRFRILSSIFFLLRPHSVPAFPILWGIWFYQFITLIRSRLPDRNQPRNGKSNLVWREEEVAMIFFLHPDWKAVRFHVSHLWNQGRLRRFWCLTHHLVRPFLVIVLSRRRAFCGSINILKIIMKTPQSIYESCNESKNYILGRDEMKRNQFSIFTLLGSRGPNHDTPAKLW